VYRDMLVSYLGGHSRLTLLHRKGLLAKGILGCK